MSVEKRCLTMIFVLMACHESAEPTSGSPLTYSTTPCAIPRVLVQLQDERYGDWEQL
jgi:hypothetical protein